MSDYYGTMIEYLESYRPELLAQIIEAGSTRQWLDDHLEQLGKAEDAIAKALAVQHPDLSVTQIRLQAEEEAIRQVLPVPDKKEQV